MCEQGSVNQHIFLSSLNIIIKILFRIYMKYKYSFHLRETSEEKQHVISDVFHEPFGLRCNMHVPTNKARKMVC